MAPATWSADIPGCGSIPGEADRYTSILYLNDEIQSAVWDRLFYKPRPKRVIWNPDNLGDRHVAITYRIVRNLQLAKGLLEPGLALTEEVIERLDGTSSLYTPSRTLVNSHLAGLADTEPLPTLPDPAMPVPKDLGISYLYVAIQLGFPNDDPALFWLHPSRFQRFLPTLDQLLVFEAELLRVVGHRYITRGRISAVRTLEQLLGNPTHPERADWARLVLARIRDYGATSKDEERALMVARLEDMLRRAKRALDLKTELSILRTLAMIQNLTFLDDSRQERELLKVLRRPELPAPKK